MNYNGKTYPMIKIKPEQELRFYFSPVTTSGPIIDSSTIEVGDLVYHLSRVPEWHPLEYAEFKSEVSDVSASLLVNCTERPFFKEFRVLFDNHNTLPSATCDCGTVFYHPTWNHCRLCTGTSLETQRPPVGYSYPFFGWRTASDSSLSQ